MTTNKHFVLGIPTDGHPECEFQDALMRDLQRGIITDWYRVRSSFIEDNRNTIVANFLNHFPNDQILLQIDDDIFWPPETIPLMLEWISEEDPVVAIEVPLLNSPVNTYKWNGVEFIQHRYTSNQGPSPYQADAIGTGIMMIHRSIFEFIPHLEWFNRVKINGVIKGEDISFCYRLHNMGLKVRVIPGLPVIHFKRVPLQLYGTDLPTRYNTP